MTPELQEAIPGLAATIGSILGGLWIVYLTAKGIIGKMAAEPKPTVAEKAAGGRADGIGAAMQAAYPLGGGWMDERGLKLLGELVDIQKDMLRLLEKAVDGKESVRVDNPNLSSKVDEVKRTIERAIEAGK